MDHLLEQFIRQKDIHYHYNIVPGHTKVEPHWKATLLTIAFHHVINKSIEYYFFCFDRNGMFLRQYQNHHFFGDPIFISWQEISHFHYHIGLLEVKMSFVYKEERFQMMLSRVMRGHPWVSENIQYLIDNQFFYK